MYRFTKVYLIFLHQKTTITDENKRMRTHESVFRQRYFFLSQRSVS
jgi:hypothetical protein